MLLKSGIGWGMMPLWMVADDLAAGRLVQLAMPDQTAFDYRVDVIYRTDPPAGPAAAWLIDRFARQASEDGGGDWWPYGISANRAAIDAVLRYHHEQGLTPRRFTIEDVFVPGLLDT